MRLFRIEGAKMEWLSLLSVDKLVEEDCEPAAVFFSILLMNLKKITTKLYQAPHFADCKIKLKFSLWIKATSLEHA